MDITGFLNHCSFHRWSTADTRDICICLHAIKNHARRFINEAAKSPRCGACCVSLVKDDMLSKGIWNDQAPDKMCLVDLLRRALHGAKGQPAGRQWQAVAEPPCKIDGLGVNAPGELVD